jgi:hypothetical protein
MPKVSALQSSFSGGEFSPLLYGRVDSDRYKTALKTCLNYYPTVQGGLTRRPGTKFVSELKDSSKKARLQSFEFSTTQAYMLEFGNLYIRFYKDNAPITFAAKTITGATAANPVVITSNAHGFSNGDKIRIDSVVGMTQLNNREFTVANVAANTFELSGINGTAFTAYASGGTASQIVEVTSTYTEAEVFDLKFTQSADVLYIAHPSHAPRKLSRTSHTAWSLADIGFLDGPYFSTNATATTLTPSATTGLGVTITASAITGINSGTGFQTTDVGRFIRIKHGAVWGWAIIVTRVSTTVVTADIQSAFGATTGVTSWRLGLWSATTGYPSAVVFHEDRLFFSGASGSPQRFDGSKSGDYENFAPTDTAGTVAADNAVGFSLNANDVNAMQWMASDEKGLLSGTNGGEWVIRASSQNEALSPTNISAKRATSYGSEDVQPVQVGKSAIFVQRSGRIIRELTYFYDVDGFRATDLTQLSEHVTQSGIVQLAYQKTPQSFVWCVRQDGVLATMTYDRDVDSLKVGWHRHIIGGQSDAAGSDAIVESVATIPSADGSRQEAWIIVKRYINGSVKRYVEYITKIFEDVDEQRDAYFVDGGLTYDNPKTITGITKANPCVVTSAAHGFSNGDKVLITDVLGMSDVNSNTYLIANVAANTFQLHDLEDNAINSTAFNTYVSGGEVRKLVSTVSGLNHLEGETVSILGDGAAQPEATVTKGVVTLSDRAATVHIGYRYNSDGEMLRLEAGAADGTALGKTRRTHRVGMLLHRTLGMAIGPDFDHLDTITFRRTSDPLTRAVGLFSGIISETVDFDYDMENHVCWRQSQPLPSTVLAIMPQMVTQDRG